MTPIEYTTKYAVSLCQFGRFARMAEYDNALAAHECVQRNWPNEKTKIVIIHTCQLWVTNGVRKYGQPLRRTGDDSGTPFKTLAGAQKFRRMKNRQVEKGVLSGENAGRYFIAQYQSGKLGEVNA